jgi:hypothetical protein
VGFIPLSTASRYDRDRTSFQEQIDELGLDAQSAAKLSCVYLRQEQLELSQCVLGANPNALAKAYKGGTLSEEDIDKLSVLIANTKNAAPAAVSADAGAASPRTKLAILAAIQTQL